MHCSIEKEHVCLDPRNLNKAILAIMHIQYPLPTIEEVKTQVTSTKLFTVFIGKSGLWQVKLDEPSSYLTTLNTPFSRYT